MNKALILAIKGNSLDDGPGIRTVVFFKGCPLNCVWCHNPESKRAVVELSWDQNECIGCLTCKTVCHVNAISKNNTFFINRDTCTLCFQCVEVCPSGAMAGVGKYMDVNGVVNEIIKDKPIAIWCIMISSLLMMMSIKNIVAFQMQKFYKIFKILLNCHKKILFS